MSSTTYKKVYEIVGEQAHLDVDQTTHLTILKDSVNLGIQEVSGYMNWWFTHVECSITTSENRSFAFPTQNVGDDYITLKSMNNQSIRTQTLDGLSWDEPEAFALENPRWTDPTYAAGSPQAVTVSGGKLALNRKPTTAWVTANPAIFLEGWQTIRQAADTSTNFLAAWTDVIPLVPDDWVKTIVQASFAHALSQSRSPLEQKAWVKLYGRHDDLRGGMMEEMAEKCRPFVGLGQDTVSPAHVFILSGGNRGRGYSDYGQRG